MKNILKKQLEQLEQTVKTPLTKPIINIRKPFDNKNGTVKKKNKKQQKTLTRNIKQPSKNQFKSMQTITKPNKPFTNQ